MKSEQHDSSESGDKLISKLLRIRFGNYDVRLRNKKLTLEKNDDPFGFEVSNENPVVRLLSWALLGAFLIGLPVMAYFIIRDVMNGSATAETWVKLSLTVLLWAFFLYVVIRKIQQ